MLQILTMMAAAQWLRIWVCIEIPGSNVGKFYPMFSCTFLSRGECSIRESQPFTVVLVFAL